ncbi:MAG: TonB-dependent receptor, partial [Gammaproteobacteria bacterium]|nr:TonB-dependent receptor [Gammaproteobacteria bacterium]
MKIPLLSFMRATLIGLFFTSSFSNAAVESRTSGTTIEEIVVTAQKREESINEVGMSIQASTGEQLKDLGVTDAFDLYKVVAGFSSNVNYAGTAIYTIRGVGFQENSLA